MKKVIAFLVGILLTCSTAFGQLSDRYFLPIHSVNAQVSDGIGEGFVAGFVVASVAIVEALFTGETSNAQLVNYTPYITAGYDYHFCGTRWTLGGEAGYWHTGLKQDESIQNFDTATLAITGKYYYKPFGNCKLYGGLNLGAGILSSGEISVFPAVQINPIGMRLGNETIAFIAELGAGYKGILQLGVNIGL